MGYGSMMINLITIIVFIYAVMSVDNMMEQDDVMRGLVCDGVAQSQDFVRYECCSACENVNMAFVKYEHDKGGMFHEDVDDCHCLDIDGRYHQIW